MQVNYDSYQSSITTEFLWKSLFYGRNSVSSCLLLSYPSFRKRNSDHLGKRKIQHATSVAIFWDNFNNILGPNLPEKLNGEHCEKMNIKTVVIYIPMPKYSPNCIYPFTIWRIPDCGRSLNLENNQFWVKFLQKITSRRSIKTTQPKNDLLLVKNMYFGWYRYYRYSRGGFRSFWLVPG